MIVLDTGALVALDRGDVGMWARVARASAGAVPVVVPVGAVAQAWRGGARQARLARALTHSEPASFDRLARAAGQLCGRAQTTDVVDASVALVASNSATRALYTSDADDLAHLLAVAGGHSPTVVPV